MILRVDNNNQRERPMRRSFLFSLTIAFAFCGGTTMSYAKSGGGAYSQGTGTRGGELTTTCHALVNAKYCGGRQCTAGAQTAAAAAHFGECMQKGGKL
jgi:hypothetical protein